MKETKIEKLILDLSTRWEVSPEEAVDRLNSMNESEINKLINSMTKKFKNGGFIDCLRNGGSISKCKCGCDKIVKGDEGIPGLRQRGTTPAYLGSQPKFDPSDSTWVRTKDGYMKNVFSGNTLEQNLVTYDENGIPRRSIREITDYMFPMDADTLYRDARGLWASKHPSIIDELFNKTHSNEYIKTVDENLEGFEPIQFNEKEVKATQKKSKKEMGGKIQKGQNGLYDLGGTPRWGQTVDLRNPYRSHSVNTPFVGMGSNFDVNTQFVRPSGASFLNKYWTPKITSDNPMSGTSLAKDLGNKWRKDYNPGSNKVGPVTNPVDVLNAGPQELMSDEEMNSRRASAKKIDDFIKSVKPMPTEPDINTQITNAKNFSQAFGLARKAGLKEFDWKGKRIAVKLKSDSPETTTQNTATKPTTQNVVNNSKPQETTVVEPWRDVLASGGAGLYPFAASVPGVGTDAYLDPTGQMGRRQTGYVAPTNSIESQVAATGVNPNSPQGRRMARLAKYSNIK